MKQIILIKILLLSSFTFILFFSGCEDKEQAVKLIELETKIRQKNLEIASLKESNELQIDQLHQLEEALKSTKQQLNKMTNRYNKLRKSKASKAKSKKVSKQKSVEKGRITRLSEEQKTIKKYLLEKYLENPSSYRATHWSKAYKVKDKGKAVTVYEHGYVEKSGDKELKNTIFITLFKNKVYSVQTNHFPTIEKMIMDNRMLAFFTEVGLSQEALRSSLASSDKKNIIDFVKSFKGMKSNQFYKLEEECQYLPYRDACENVLYFMRRLPNVSLYTFGLVKN